jgi:hypothetical protein
VTKKKKRKFFDKFHNLRNIRRRDGMEIYVRTFFILLLTQLERSDGMSPATIHVDRNWDIPDSTKVGEIVKTVRVTGNYDPNTINFTLEPEAGPWGSSENPFWINPQTGFVYLNMSLVGWVRLNFNLNFFNSNF